MEREYEKEKVTWQVHILKDSVTRLGCTYPHLHFTSCHTCACIYCSVLTAEHPHPSVLVQHFAVPLLLCPDLHPLTQTHSQDPWILRECVLLKRVPPSVNSTRTHTPVCTHEEQRANTLHPIRVKFRALIGSQQMSPELGSACHTGRVSLVCFRARVCCDETNFKIKWEAKQLVWCCGALCFGGLSSFSRGILLTAQSTKSQTLSAHLARISLIHSLYLGRLYVWILCASPCFLAGWTPTRTPPLHLRNVPSFFLAGHVYLCLIKQAPHFLMPGPQTGSLLARHPGQPQRRALP